jgi:hypothetical protein
MKKNDIRNIPTSQLPNFVPSRPSVAMLWDESFLWGLMAHKALTSAGLPFTLVRAEDVRNGCLDEYTALFVPGGWASNKVKALGDDGVAAIKKFVHGGGAYLGFCGGAGLATMDGIGLLQVKRRPTKERVPSFSGRIKLKVNNHSLWEGVPACEDVNSEFRIPNSELLFNAWWPSQFIIDSESVTVLATYGEAMADSFSSDLNVGDAETAGSWTELERLYQINLDPKRLINEPAVIEGTFGKGRVLLSLVHFDTPEDLNGATMLRNIWNYFGYGQIKRSTPAQEDGHRSLAFHDPLLSDLEAAVNGLIELGQRNFLWFWRNSMLLQWRRGVRGLEYCTLSVMVREIADLLKRQNVSAFDEDLKRTGELLLPFVDKAKRLLIRERLAMLNSPITYERCDDPEIQALREKLFSRSKSHGGLFKEVLDEADRLLYRLMILR